MPRHDVLKANFTFHLQHLKLSVRELWPKIRKFCLFEHIAHLSVYVPQNRTQYLLKQKHRHINVYDEDAACLQ